jgi:hypothetical protein
MNRNSRCSALIGKALLLCTLPCCALALTGFGARDAGGKGGAETESEPGFYRDRVRENAQNPEPPAEKAGPEFNGKEILRVSGRVRLVGSAALSSLVISGEQGEWYVEGGEGDKLMSLQHQNVTVEGRPDSEEMILANGQRLGRRLILRDVRIIDSPS